MSTPLEDLQAAVAALMEGIANGANSAEISVLALDVQTKTDLLAASNTPVGPETPGAVTAGRADGISEAPDGGFPGSDGRSR